MSCVHTHVRDINTSVLVLVGEEDRNSFFFFTCSPSQWLEGGWWKIVFFIHLPRDVQSRLQICEILCRLLLIRVIYNTHTLATPPLTHTSPVLSQCPTGIGILSELRQQKINLKRTASSKNTCFLRYSVWQTMKVLGVFWGVYKVEETEAEWGNIL